MTSEPDAKIEFLTFVVVDDITIGTTRIVPRAEFRLDENGFFNLGQEIQAALDKEAATRHPSAFYYDAEGIREIYLDGGWKRIDELKLSRPIRCVTAYGISHCPSNTKINMDVFDLGAFAYLDVLGERAFVLLLWREKDA